MPLQNRVLPSQEIVASAGRGLLMGNRGSLHDTDRRLGTTRWRSKAWLCCLLDYKGVSRDPMPPGRWTALFFFDEAVALAAGHRPCAYCRRTDFVRYGEAWARGHDLTERPKAAAMDAVLHRQRVEPHSRRQRTTRAILGELPDGAMIAAADGPALVLNAKARPWSWDGYSGEAGRPSYEEVTVLTPPANLVVLKAGYVPLLHSSAVGNKGEPN
ncbi:hypothetical protein [Kribbella sp. DT2]|uniref:hypothetical protein n=1 Tax=Kribbella sp. DT2 TaxID=3393427 RepID=UPI003CF875C9